MSKFAFPAVDLAALPSPLTADAFSQHRSEDQIAELRQRVQTTHNLKVRAFRFYDALKDRLERSHPDQYVWIAVDAGDYMVGRTVLEVIEAAQRKFGDVPSYVAHIGHFDDPTRPESS